MALKPFSAKELIPKLPANTQITASMDSGKLFQFRLKNFDKQSLSRRFQAAIDRASSKIALELKQALDEAMESGVWRAVDGINDIVDTGALMESGRVVFSNKGLSIEYTEPYAALVHYGGYINPYGNQASRVYLPPRPWIDAVLTGNGPVAGFNFSEYYRKEIQAEFG